MIHSGDFIQEWQIFEQKIDIITIPVRNEGIGGLLIDKGRQKVYGVSDKTGTFFVYDYLKKKVRKIGKIDNNGFFNCNDN